MSSKAEKTSHHLYQHPRLSIFFRNPLLLKIVTWLGTLSLIGSTGVVWALKPISTSQAEAQALPNASASAEIVATERQIYGPYLPVTQIQSPIRVAPAQLPNREVPIAVAPASASISPTGKIVRPQHTDLLTADLYTVGVNSTTAEFVNLPVPAPLSKIIPSQTREIVTTTRSQIQPSYVAKESTVSQSAPATSIPPQATAASSNGHRVVPTVVSLPAAKSTSPRIDRSRAVSTPPQRPTISTQGTPLIGIKPTVITPMKSPAMGTLTAQSEPRSTDIITADIIAINSIEIFVPAPKTQRIEVQPVARLPQISEIKTVPTVSTIPSVRPSQSLIAFTSTGQNELSELIYPLSAPAPTTSSFGWRTHPITGSRRFHSGVDIGAPTGAPVVAAGSGTIVSSGWLGGYGKAIVIQHNGVQQTLYGHLSEIFVQPGQIVEQGTVIGRVGSTGNSTGPHLHYETKVATPDGWIAVDPGENIKYALANLRRSMPFAQRDLPPGYN